MAYEKQNFENGKPLDAAQLNHIENGIEELENKMPAAGVDGADGLTPYIGLNGNWYLGEVDTGVRAQGVPGANGKSAYSYAKEGGYTGTEEEFAAKLADDTVDPEQVNSLIDTRMRSVTSFGAVGDGVADDTEAFQTALAQNRVVNVPGGTYKLSGTMVIKENCCMELSQDTVLNFTQTSGNCIEMRGSATLRGNHAIIKVPYEFAGNVIDIDTLDDGTDHATSIPPYGMSSPMFKRQRFIYDVNIIKPTDFYGKIGFCVSADGTCHGTGIYLSATNIPQGEENPDNNDIPWMWALNLSGIRIAGGFSYGIHAINYDTPEGSTGHYEDDAWNHDMRVEAVIEGCEIAVALENCNGAHLNVTVQPTPAKDNGAKYAKHGIYLRDCRFVDLMRSRIWDWNANNSLWTYGGQYQHIAMIGNCRGLLLDDFLCHETGYDIRELIYTDTAANFDTMTVLQEPGNKWFKSVENKPYFFDGTANRSLRLKSEKIAADETYFIHAANGEHIYTPNFENLVPESTDTDGSIFNGNGYQMGAGLSNSGAVTTGLNCTVSGFIPTGGGHHTYRIAGTNISYDAYGCNICFYDSDFNHIKAILYSHIGESGYWGELTQEETTLITWTSTESVSDVADCAYIRVAVNGRCSDLTVTIDEPVEYKTEWQGEPMRLDESIYAQKAILKSPGGKVFELTVAEDGTLSTVEFAE